MSCDVCIGSDCDDGIVETLSESHPKARKPHKCLECKREILPGETYECFVGVWEGKIQRYNTCALCEEIRAVFCCGGGWIWGSLWDDMREIAFPILTTATECFQELSPAAKQFVLDKWAKWKGLSKAERGEA